jgi:HEAT repeat protein
MARFGDARGGAHLISRIETAADDRPIAAEWAGRLGVQEAIPTLSELADSEGDAAQGAAIRALGRLKAPGAEERLLRLVADPDAPEDLRMDAAEGLAELATPAALDLLKQLAQGEPSELSQLSQELLAEVEANAG